MSYPDATAIEESPKGMGEFSRLTGVFFEPTKTFTDIAARPRWVFPMLLIILAGIVYIALFSQHVGWDRMLRQQFAASSRSAQLTPEQRDQQLAAGEKFAPVIGYAGTIFGIPIAFLIIAGVLTGIVAGIMSAPVRFKQVFAIQCYASLTGLVFMALAITVMFLKNPDDFDLRNPLMFNPGAFMDPLTTSKFVYSLAGALDLFAIWKMVLIAVGLKAAAGKALSFGGALVAVFLPWGIFVLCAAALAGIFS